MKDKNPISSSEVGTLWLTYQEKTMILRILEYFIEKSDDQQAKNIMGGLWQELSYYVTKIKKIFQEQGIAIPVGFNQADVNLEAPKLYDNGFDIMFVRILKEISMGMYTLNMNMAYQDDVMGIYEGLTSTTQKIYKSSTLYLLEKGILTLPPKVTMPKSSEFIESKNYLNGFNPFNDKRALNDIELGYLHHGIETNNIGMQLITGFAQCAEDKEVKQYFVKGKELAKKQIKVFGDILLESDVQFSATSGSTVTTSKVAPFSQKLMMFCIYLLNGFGIVGSSFGTIFSLRKDLSMKTALIAKDIYFYADEGVKIMIKNGWLEEPPQMEDRPNLIKE
ncbi:DUF3231 family protein [Priestia megaterium]|uniref:DUF3231 family protein n=3 Tax=Priestia megaterium TaxID=1404 RepID=UPI000BF3D768|nr:DUF3231 family protein [Priestia megaterium]MBZ5482514.1 DUF3231 family protein [Bacillus sp. T_4]PFI69620.1 hypothetical protein COI68_00030 [Priestia megaterium]PGK52793.1 hypothetical protein CN918_25095 [Priestia megaterium]PGQ87350.1 hypothetical protein COA18_07625 [Priestia megaterium]PGZ80458.1 hypothetical protein COE55_07235 [Priestia megaterium]